MKITRATVSRCTISDFYRFQIFFISLGPFCVRNHECHFSSQWVLIYMVTHNHGYIKFGSTYKILETSYTFFSNFWAACGLQLFWYSKYVGIHKCGWSNFVGTQNWWQLEDIDILVIMLLHKVVALEMLMSHECIQNKWVFKSAYKYFGVLKMLELYCLVTKSMGKLCWSSL